MDVDFDGKFRLESVRKYLKKRKTMRNISSAIIFSKLIKTKVKNNVVLTSHVLLIWLAGWLADGWMAAGWRLDGGWLTAGWLALKIFSNLGL